MKGFFEFAKAHPIVTFLIVDAVCVCIKQVVHDVTEGVNAAKDVVYTLDEM